MYIYKRDSSMQDCFWPAMPDSILDIVMGLSDRWSMGSWWCKLHKQYFILLILHKCTFTIVNV